MTPTVVFLATATAQLSITTLPARAMIVAPVLTRIDESALEMTAEAFVVLVLRKGASMLLVKVGSRLTVLTVSSEYGRAAPSFTNTSGGASSPTTARSGRPSAVRSAAATAATPLDVNP